MIIATGTLFFVLAVFVNSKELSPLHSFWDLFPESLGERLPAAKTLKYKDTDKSWNLRKLVDNKVTQFDSHSILLARAQIIVGWLAKDKTIEPLSDLSGRTDHVFDSTKKKFVKVDEWVRDGLGVTMDLSRIIREDKIPTCRPNAKSLECRVAMQVVYADV